MSFIPPTLESRTYIQCTESILNKNIRFFFHTWEDIFNSMRCKVFIIKSSCILNRVNLPKWVLSSAKKLNSLVIILFFFHFVRKVCSITICWNYMFVCSVIQNVNLCHLQISVTIGITFGDLSLLDVLVLLVYF